LQEKCPREKNAVCLPIKTVLSGQKGPKEKNAVCVAPTWRQ